MNNSKLGKLILGLAVLNIPIKTHETLIVVIFVTGYFNGNYSDYEMTSRE